ncbi:MAG: DNA-binding transcriptional MerR regulator [Crocinitomix sp.]|jgi:DNA-binding transcriptional MerR regulator
MEEELKTHLENVRQVTEVMFEENFQLSDIGLAAKTAFDWSNAGIYLRERKSKYRRKYNGVEYVWLRLVKELREFGLPIHSILNLKNYLLSEMNLMEHYTSLFEREEMEDETWNEFIKDIKVTFKTPENFIEAVESDKKKVNLSNTKLSVLLFSTILSQSNAHLAISKDGNCMVFEESPMQDLFTSSMIMNQPYISIPLNHIVSEFMGREDLYALNLKASGIDLTEEEVKVIDMIRKGGINSLTVKFVDGEVNLIETEERIDIKDAKGRLVDLIQKGGYQEISYKTENGKIVYVKRKTKHK